MDIPDSLSLTDEQVEEILILQHLDLLDALNSTVTETARIGEEMLRRFTPPASRSDEN